MENRLNVFIASATEGLDVANAVRDVLNANPAFDARVWDQGAFQTSLTFIESLEQELDQSDFAIVTLTPDDYSVSRGTVHLAPRDNVIFELGFFMGRLGAFGRLGRQRTFFVLDRNADLKIPTDLLGVQPAEFERRDGDTLSAAIARIAGALAQSMTKEGIRAKPGPEGQAELLQLQKFCRRIAGAWWEKVAKKGDLAVSFCLVTSNDVTGTVQIEGRSIDAKGSVFAEWNSVAAGIRVTERTLLYAWEGKRKQKKGFEGFGQYTFFETPEQFVAGDGIFADVQDSTDTMHWVPVEIRRIDPVQVAAIKSTIETGTDDERRVLLATSVLPQFAATTGVNAPLS